jgi:hypothetical protein
LWIASHVITIATPVAAGLCSSTLAGMMKIDMIHPTNATR